MDKDCANVDELLSGYLDDELTQKDRQRVDRHIEGCARCSARLRELDALSASVSRLRADMVPEDQEEWRKVMDNALERTASGIGWVLVVGAVFVLVGYAGYEFLLADVEPPMVKWAVGALYLGLAVLLLSVLRQRLRARKTDKYKDVEI
ncbi:MAG: zf-HC2 domain-containing protein [Gammaproteobacteria bacterium]|nr:zf-HC2 domain-containing protein [Gammaproteobacteria bacterium]